MNEKVAARLKSLERWEPDHGSDMWFLLSLLKRYSDALENLEEHIGDESICTCQADWCAEALAYDPEGEK